MRYKIALAVGLAVGYVLGSKAGRERYDEIRRQARSFKDNPTVQETAGVVQAQAFEIARIAKEKASDKLSQTKVGSTVGSLAPNGSPDGGTRHSGNDNNGHR